MKVQVKNQTLSVNGRLIPMISGEVHYWRLDTSVWRKVLRRVKDMGLEIISTYVPWDFHEISPRQYDFLGVTDPRRNVKAYLDLLEEEGFYVLFRPGPYIYSEWKNQGIPDRVTGYHRSHSELVKEARHYLESLFEVVRPHLASHGGKILMVQPDNELDPMLYAYEDQLGLVDNLGNFHEYLCEKYKRIQNLNHAWGTHCKSFADARPVCDWPTGSPEFWPRFLDFKEFIYWHVSEMGKIWVREFRRVVPDMPLYLNVYPFYEVQPWKNLARSADLSALDIYPTQEFHAEPWEHRDFIEKMRALRISSPVPFIAEFQSGTWHGYHMRSGMYSPNHYRMCAVSALLGGATGWSWYMLVNRDNWYLCPIDEWAQVRPELYDMFKDIVRVFKQIRPYELKSATQIGVTFYPLHYTTRQISKEDALLKSLYEADIHYEYVDVEESISGKKLVFYSGPAWLPLACQEKLLKFVESGGILVSFLQYPYQDEKMKAVNMIGFHEPYSVLGEKEGIGCDKFLEISLGGRNVDIKSPFYIFSGNGGKVFEARAKKNQTVIKQWGLPYGRKYPVGYIEKRGKGALIHLGTSPTPELLRALLDELQIYPGSRSETAAVQTALYHAKDRYCLFVVNSGNESKSARIAFQGSKIRAKKAKDLFSGQEYPFSVSGINKILEVPVARKDGSVLIF